MLDRDVPAAREPRLDLTPEQLLTTTRAVRHRLDLKRSVPLSVVMACIRLAIQAPSAQNSQRWRWVVVTDPELRIELARIWRRDYVDRRPNNTQPQALQRIFASSDHLSSVLADVPVLVIPCLLDRPPQKGGNKELLDFYGSGLPAVWSFSLALRLHGLGTTFTTMHLNHEEEAGALLGIPSTVTQLALLPVAYTTGTQFTPAPRRPAEEITYLNGWRQTDASSSSVSSDPVDDGLKNEP